MTGSELNKIYEQSGLTGEEFAKKLDISRGNLYGLFKEPVIPEFIEIKMNSDSDINKIIQYREQKLTPYEPETNQWAQAISGLIDSVKMATTAINGLRDSIDLHKRAFDLIEKDHLLHTEMLSKGMKEGLFKLVPSSKK